MTRMLHHIPAEDSRINEFVVGALTGLMIALAGVLSLAPYGMI